MDGEILVGIVFALIMGIYLIKRHKTVGTSWYEWSCKIDKWLPYKWTPSSERFAQIFCLIIGILFILWSVLAWWFTWY